jgi:ubiquinone/menaquinone biosynthesis C-methylase UbiE
MSYVYMKVLESAPERYDRGMRILTLGRLERARRDVAALIEPGQRVLDIGCGTGTLAVLMAQRGAQVVGVDIAPPMLAIAARRVREAGLEERIELRELGAVELDNAFPNGSFDCITSSLVFSELSPDEMDYTLRQCHRLLMPGGQLVITDEVLPDSLPGQLATLLLRLPFAILTFILTQNTTRRVGGLAPRITAAGFHIIQVRHYLLGTLRIYIAQEEG